MENSSYFESLEAKAKVKYCEKLACVGLSFQDDFDEFTPHTCARGVNSLNALTESMYSPIVSSVRLISHVPDA